MGLKLCTLSTFWSDYVYLRREQQPAFWLTLNVALGFIYALGMALGADQFLARRKRRSDLRTSVDYADFKD